MSLPQILRNQAGLIIESVKAENVSLGADLHKAEQAVSELKAKFANRLEIQRRLLAYTPERGRDPDCPYCWLMNGTHSPVKPIEKPGEADHFRCKECGSEFSDPNP